MSGLTQISLTETAVFVALRSVLGEMGFTTADPNGLVPIVKGQVNRVASPKASDFVVMWPLMRNRLATNIDENDDVTVTGQIVNNILSAGTVTNGSIFQGLTLFGAGLAAPVKIQSQINGVPGGIGQYALAATANLTSQTFRAGSHRMQEYVELTIQCDVHGPSSADNAAILVATFRDYRGVELFDAQGLDIAPLYADDPRQLPFTTAEDQWEDRWVVDLHLQINPIVSVTQEFADALSTAIIEVETTYPL